MRLLDFDLIEIARALQLGYEIGHGVDRGRFALDAQRIAFARYRRQPQRVGAHHGVRQRVHQLLAAGAVALQLLDHVDALLQDVFLALERLHLRLQVLKARFFALLLFDVGLQRVHLAGELRVVIPEHSERDQQRCRQQDHLKCGFKRHRLARRFGTNPAE